MSSYAIAYPHVLAAVQRIAATAHKTPVMTCAALDRLAGRSLYFKCEQWQKSGSFKFRGASNAVLKLGEDEARKGVVTHSSGNHAQALALAARLRGMPAHIVMPSNAAKVKRRAVEEYGGQVVECEPTLAARAAKVKEVQEQTGAILIPPYNHPDVMAGQGTTAVELLAQVPELDAIVTPVGGGGLLSGATIGGKGVKPALRVFGAEPLGADDAARSKAAGTLIPQTGPRTVADGLLTSLGDLTWPVIRDQVEAIHTVTEEEIIQAMRLCWERAKLLIEPSAAVALAVALTPAFRAVEGVQRLGIVLSGGNVDLDRLPWC